MYKKVLFKLKVKSFFSKLTGKKMPLSNIALSMLKPNDNILEAGAHIGYDTIMLAGLTKGKVYAFEPISDLYQQLLSKTINTANIETFEIALGKINGPMTMYVSSGQSDASSSLLKPKEHINTNPDVFFQNSVTVNVQTLATWAETNSVKKIDFMWLDMQGAELDMLTQSGSLIEIVRIIYTEVANIELYENQAIYSELKQWLIGKGFRLFAEELTWGYTGNVLFIK